MRGCAEKAFQAEGTAHAREKSEHFFLETTAGKYAWT